MKTQYDVVVIGGGPAGSTCGALLAERGFEVLIAERARFPRFHIGESLLPYNVPLFQRLGVWNHLLEHGFQRKYGGHFVFEPGGKTVRLDFSRSLDRGLSTSLQVRRAEFDRILLDNAERLGAEIRQGCRAERVYFEDGETGPRAVGLSLTTDAGETKDVDCRMVVDATGRDTLIGRQLGTRERDAELRQAALFTHVEGAELGLGPEGGDILIVGGPFGWFWMIPLDADTASVGVVVPGRVLKEAGGDRQSIFKNLMDSSPTIARRLDGARFLRPVEATADFSYRCRSFTGDGWLMAGDAAGFLDPVFSSGVLLAMRTAEKAADQIAKALPHHQVVRQHHLAAYERFARRGLDRFRRYVLAFYEPSCAATFAEQPPPLLRGAITSAFAGKVFERDPRIWLMEQFFFARAAHWRRRAERGDVDLPPAPARA